MDSVKEFLLESVKEYEYVVETPAPSVVLEEYGESTLKLSVRAWGTTEKYWDLYYDLREIILKALDAHGIEKPHNQLEVKLRDNAPQGRKNA